jgi:hypothetical protein
VDQDPPYEQLFDLEQDPLETNNLAADRNYGEVLQEMRRRFDTHKKSIRNSDSAAFV